MCGVAISSVLFVALLSVPAWAQPVPTPKEVTTQEPANSDKGKVEKTNPKGLQVEPVDIKPNNPKGKKGKKHKAKGKKWKKTDKSNPRGLQVEPVDIRPVEK